jgi:hypothetical protein
VQRQCPLSGAKRTCRFALHMSAYDPKRTSVVPLTGPSHLALAAAAPRCASRKIRRQCCGASISGPRPLPLGNAARRGDVWWWQRLTTIVHAFFCSRSQHFTRVTKVKWARRLSVAGKSQSSRHLTAPKNKRIKDRREPLMRRKTSEKFYLLESVAILSPPRFCLQFLNWNNSRVKIRTCINEFVGPVSISKGVVIAE